MYDIDSFNCQWLTQLGSVCIEKSPQIINLDNVKMY